MAARCKRVGVLAVMRKEALETKLPGPPPATSQFTAEQVAHHLSPGVAQCLNWLAGEVAKDAVARGATTHGAHAAAQAAVLAAAVEAAALAQTGDFTAAGAPVGQLARLHTRHAEEAMANQVARCQAKVGTINYTYIWYIEHGLLKELDEAMHREVEASLKRGNL